MTRIFCSLPGTSDPSPSLYLPLHTTPKTSLLAKKSLKSLLFDLTVIASFVAAACLGVHKLLGVPEHPGSAAIGSDYGATESATPTLTESRRQLQELQQMKSETEEKTRLRDELVAARVNLPLTDGEGEEDLTHSVSQADEVLLQIESSERVSELERLELPLSAGMDALEADLHAHDLGGPEQMQLTMRFMRDYAARLNEFKGKVAMFRELDARMVGRGVDMSEGHRKKMDEYEELNNVFEDLWRSFKKLGRHWRSVGSPDL